ncbi:MAG: hypothetical protein IPH31_14395 [Lewinellaceae bacterium]|nr:hypothetical protein [Lewinellaceae bacterium]
MKKILYLFVWLICAKITMAQTQDATLVIPIGHTGGITAVDLSPDGRYFLTGSLDQTIKIWDGNGYEIRTLVGHGMNVWPLLFLPKQPAIQMAGNLS